MKCKRCGKELKPGDKFCMNCGAKVEKAEIPAGLKNDQGLKNIKQNTEAKKKSKIPVIAAVLAVIVLAAAAAAGGLLLLPEYQRQKVVSEIEKLQIPEYTEQADSLEDQWRSTGILDLSEKNDLIHELKDIKTEAENFQECKEDVEHLENEKETYNLDEVKYSAYVEALTACETAINEDRASEALALYDQAKQAREDLISANDAYIQERMELYESLDLENADADVKAGYEENMKTLDSLESAENGKDYAAFKEAFAKMDATVYMYIEPENPLSVSVQQVDASDFPKVKLYLQILNSDTGEVPEDLESSFFYINKKDANAQYIKETVTAVNQLNEQEALKVDMVADVSDSMSGSPMAEAQSIMKNFVNSVQFQAGDMVELTAFSNGVYLEKEFTSDPDTLIAAINDLHTDNMTSLYDALYTAVGRAASQTGARCVIAFTDGLDNYSQCSADDVINLANRYHIPVFIIGIGDADYSGVKELAEQTGGKYYNSQDVYGMEGIYDEIYRMEKELYLLEYEDTSGAEITDQADIQVGYRSLEYGGECEYVYTPNTLLSVDADVLYTDGPEAVVEKYMKNFDDAMTNMDFSYIEDCLLPGSSIYEEQKAYVQRGIEEQLDSYEIVKAEYSDENNCIVTTRETYYVRVQGEPLQLMTQECRYQVVKNGGDWKMSAFAGDIHVLSRIDQ